MLELPKLYFYHNRVRKEHGLKPLYWSWKLAWKARIHTVDMAMKNDLFHDANLNNEMLSDFPRAHYWGENVGVGPTQEDLHRAFMNSTGHRRNVLYPAFDKIGIGLKKVDGKLWVTVRFVDV